MQSSPKQRNVLDWFAAANSDQDALRLPSLYARRVWRAFMPPARIGFWEEALGNQCDTRPVLFAGRSAFLHPSAVGYAVFPFSLF